MKSQSQNPLDDSFGRLKERIYLRLKEEQIEDKLFEVVKDEFEKSLKSENIILSRIERNRLLHVILKSVLNDILTRI